MRTPAERLAIVTGNVAAVPRIETFAVRAGEVTTVQLPR
jgi:hypothetical protein